MKRITLTETELTRLIRKVINEAETANCKCCDAGVQNATTPGILYVQAEKQKHAECCKACKDEQGGMISNGGKRREFNETDDNPDTLNIPVKPGMPVPPVNDDKISPAMTSAEFMTEIDNVCVDINEGREKMLGNRSCGRCHIPIMNLLKHYCLVR